MRQRPTEPGSHRGSAATTANSTTSASHHIGAWSCDLARRLNAGRVPDEADWRDSDRHYRYRLTTSQEDLAEAARLEQQVWDEMSYGDLAAEGYLPHIESSRTFAAFHETRCVGVTRLFRTNTAGHPPFTELPFHDETERASVLERCSLGLIEEVGTAAVAPEGRGLGVNTRLWRLAYRDARARGVRGWGAIMEPERVNKMNQRHGFTFQQLGDPVVYQGGDCAPHLMDLAEVDRRMRRSHPIQHFWFVRRQLRPRLSTWRPLGARGS